MITSMLRVTMAMTGLLIAAGVSGAEADPGKALAAPSRPQADRDRDADRKPAELMRFFGVHPGMTALDLIAGGGYMTEVLSIAVGPKGKVYSQNPPAMLEPGGRYLAQVEARFAGGRLPNVVRVDEDLPASNLIAPGSVDFAITAMNLHDLYNRDPAKALAFMKAVFTTLKPGGVFGVIDHVGKPGADNAKLHRMPKQAALDLAGEAGFTVEAESNLLAHPQDGHTQMVFAPGLRGKTDQFVLKLHKPR